MGHEFGVRLALIAFATALIEGLMTRSDFEPTLTTALVTLVLFYILGFVCGEMARRVVEENVAAEPTGGLPPSAAPLAPSR